MVRILSSLAVMGSLLIGFNGCTDKEKKAKEIKVQKIIDDKKTEDDYVKSIKKKDTGDYKW